ncbi:MAG: transposase [bacterium]|nr:transposase [bacterium]
MRKTILAEGEYYHIYNRGVEKRNIFLNDNDKWRFMTLLLIFQGKGHIDNMQRIVKLVQHSMLNKEPFDDILLNKKVELICFCLMPNHYHLILKEIKNGGISSFGQRLGNSYTKYFNTKYKRTGHLFGGRFQTVHITQNTYLKHLSSYIHNNLTELNNWKKLENEYFWSSLPDYVNKNRWDKFLNPEIILNQFRGKNDYLNYIKNNRNKIKKLDGYYID